MAKRQHTYAGYSATDLKNRASIPASTNITTGSTYIDCSNILLSDVKNVLGESSSSLGYLYSSPNINQYSYFNTGY